MKTPPSTQCDEIFFVLFLMDITFEILLNYLSFHFKYVWRINVIMGYKIYVNYSFIPKYGKFPLFLLSVKYTFILFT